jgi:hypothetical protein
LEYYIQKKGSKSLWSVIKNYKGGKTIIGFRGELSFSEKYNTERMFSGDSGEERAKVILHVKTNKGLPIQSISKFPSESEHLMPP